MLCFLRLRGFRVIKILENVWIVTWHVRVQIIYTTKFLYIQILHLYRNLIVLSANHVSVNNIPRIIAYCPPNIIVQYFDASWKTCILKNNLNDVIFRRTNMYSCVNIFMVKNVTNVYKLSHVQGWESNLENWKFWLGLALPFLEIQLRLIICFFTAHLSNWQN